MRFAFRVFSTLVFIVVAQYVARLAETKSELFLGVGLVTVLTILSYIEGFTRGAYYEGNN